MIEFRFPLVLFLYLPLVILWVLGRIKKTKLLPDTVPELKMRLLSGYDSIKVVWKHRLFFFGMIVLIFAASGPQIGTRLAPLERKGVDLVFAIDVSSSMEAEDVKPTRLEKAKFEISQIIRQLKGDRVAFIVFAGSSHLYLPLTTDYEAAHLFLDAIDTKMIPTQGTALSTALNTGISAFSDESKKFKVLVLVTDGEDHEGKAVGITRDVAKHGFVVHTVGVGTRAGSLIPVISDDGSRDYKRDSGGKLVTSVLNEDILIEIAQAGNGVYVQFDNKPANFIEITSAIDRMEKKTLQAHMFSEYEDRYQIFSLISLVLFTLSILIPTQKKGEENWRGRFVK